MQGKKREATDDLKDKGMKGRNAIPIHPHCWKSSSERRKLATAAIPNEKAGREKIYFNYMRNMK